MTPPSRSICWRPWQPPDYWAQKFSIVGLSTRTALTLVQLGIDLTGITTRTTMAKGLELAFARLGLDVVRRGPRAFDSRDADDGAR